MRVGRGLSGLASLARLNLRGGGGADAEALAVLRSRRLAEEYISRHDFLSVL